MDIKNSKISHRYGNYDKNLPGNGEERAFFSGRSTGDAYMCAGGLPYPLEDHAVRVVQAALAMVDLVDEVKSKHLLGPSGLDIRIGINTGPVVAGVVGTKKFAYDIWGDAVNVASRMETNSEPGKINLSEHTYVLVKNQFDCTYRGEIHIKNRGIMKMYFVERTKEMPAENFQ